MKNENPNSNTHVGFNSFYFPDQRVSTDKKQQKSWYIPTYDYIINLGESLNNKAETIRNLNSAKGDVSEETKNAINSIINKLGVKADAKNPDTTANITTYINDIDIITPIKERYMGEFEKAYHNFYCSVTDEDTMIFVDHEAGKFLKDLLQVKFIETLNALLKEQDPENPQPVDNEKLAEKVEEFKRRILDKEGEKAKNLLDYISRMEDVAEKFTQLFYYWFATEEVYSYRYICPITNKVKYEVVPPYEYYRIPSRSPYVEDDAMGFRRYKLSLNEIKKKFGDQISDADLKYLRDESGNRFSTGTSVSAIQSRILDDTELTKYYGTFFNNQQGNLILTSDPNYIEVNHVFFETETKVGILTYVDTDGMIKEQLVDPSYELDLEAGDVNLEIEYKPEIYEGWRLGRFGTGIYLTPKPLDIALGTVGIEHTLKAPFNGRVGIFMDNGLKPIPRRIEGYSYLYRLYSHLEVLEISKFKNFVSVIPESLLIDSDQFTISERLDRMYQDSLLIVKDTEIPNIGMVAQLLKSLGSPEQASFIEFLSNVKNKLKQEAWEAANMNSERYGDIDTRGRVGNTEQAIVRVSTGSIPLHVAFDRFRERDYQYLIDCARVVYQEGISTSFTNSTGKYVKLDIKPGELTFKQIGVFVKKDPNEEEKLKRFRDLLSFSAAQSGEFEIAAEAIDSDNPKELKKYILEFKEKLRKREDEANQQQQQVQQYVAEKQAEQEQKNNEAKINEITTEHDLITQREIYLKELDLYMKTLQLQSDGENSANLNIDTLKENAMWLKNSLEERKIQLKQKDQELKMKDIQSKERIAKMNKN